MDYPRYDPSSPVTPLTPAELDALDRLLQGLTADGVMTLDGVDGYLTALLVAPEALLATLATPEWLPIVWGGDGDGGSNDASPFASKRQKKATVVQLLRHLRHLAEQLTRSPDDWEPIFSVAEQGADEWVDAGDWCAGFLQAVDLWPSVWDAVTGDAGMSAAMAPLLELGGGLGTDQGTPPAADSTSSTADPVARDRLSRAVPDVVLQLQARRSNTDGV